MTRQPVPAAAPSRPTSRRKREAVLAAAEEAFLGGDYGAVTIDDIAERSGVAKQTVYAYFGSKQGLFLELVTTMTTETGDRVDAERLEVTSAADVPPALTALLDRQLAAVLTPRIVQLRRLVIGEAHRFPDLAHALAHHGPSRAIESLATHLADLDRRGLLAVPDAPTSAGFLNWLVMGGPINEAMFHGAEALPAAAARTEHVRRAVDLFVAAHRP
ncbi:TetR/AcrR family transcriptional regulator [Nocardioides panacisoli]|uniref:TetR/AcrR family transcriptional regulator n=1 Tax=Nocardioides panacisoli TaxID=627624 RepID=UPI001C637295|nr:TetR/AcrR family transcriptional regulator [Nocardioides panacisoli]QYJ03333.1 TetR/AcrR family transcriptional regulator [Nocardioides panacisoli]